MPTWSVNVRAPFLAHPRVLSALKNARGQVVFVELERRCRPRCGTGNDLWDFEVRAQGLADGLRSDVNRNDIRVLSVFPGRTATPMQALVYRLEGKEYQPERLLQAEDVADAVLSAVSLPRTAEVTDLHLRPMLKT